MRLERRAALELLANPAYKTLIQHYQDEINALTYELSHVHLEDRTRIEKMARLKALEEFVAIVERSITQ
jgi:hypothetical protein